MARTLNGRLEDYATLTADTYHSKPISQLQFDRERQADNNGTLRVRNRPDVPGWFYTSTADQVYYYFLAILNTTAELRPLYAEYLELVRAQTPTLDLDEKLLRSLKIDKDLLIYIPTRQGPCLVRNCLPRCFRRIRPCGQSHLHHN